MTHYHDAMVRERLLRAAPFEKAHIETMSFGEIKGSYVFLHPSGVVSSMLIAGKSIEDSVREDVAILRSSPFVAKGTPLVGMKYDVETGEVTVVE